MTPRLVVLNIALSLLSLFAIFISTGVHAAGVLIAQYHMEEAAWNGTAGELTDTAGYTSGPFNGQALGSLLPSPVTTSPARAVDPGTCGYASMPGPASNGGAFTIPNLPVSLVAGAKTSVAFWMYWDGTESVMPIGWNRHDLWLVSGSFGFNTANSDVFGISSAGLANGWHHVVAVFTNGSVTGNQLYIDGVAQTLTQRRSTPRNANATVSTTLRIGGWQASSGYRFSGRIDEVNVYNGTVSAAQVADLYNQVHPCPVPPAKPVAEWRFDEQAGNTAYDESAGNQHGTVVGNVSVGGTGKLCSGFTYDGGYVSLPATFPNYVNGITIAAWFRPSDVSTPGQRIFADDEHNSGGYAISLGDGGSGRVRFFSRGPRPVSLDSSAVVTAGSWYFVAAVADTVANTKRLFIYDASGNLLDSQSQNWSGSWGIDNGVPSIGGETDGSAESRFRFKGEIDELVIFDVALTSAEINAGYTHQNAGRNWDGSDRSCPVLIAEYLMDENGWSGTPGELKDTGGYVGGPFHGEAIGNPFPTSSRTDPALAGNTGTCGYANMPGPTNNGGAFSIPNLPVSVAPGAQTSVAFWMYWDGTNSVMPIGWNRHDLWLVDGHFGFNTGNGDVYGISSAGLANGWHHVVAVFKNGSVVQNRLYIDGVDQALNQRRSTPNTAAATVSTTLRIGGWQTNNSYRFRGRIDQVKVYTGAVNQPLVNSLYSETNPCNFTSPVLTGLWRFDEEQWDGSPGEVVDSSGLGGNGRAVGDANTRDPGRLCRAGYFDGAGDFVQVNNLSSQLNGSASLAFWIKTTQRGDNTAWRAPGVTGVEQSGGTDDIFWGWLDAAGRIGVSVGNDSSTKSTVSISDGSWHHVVLTRDATVGAYKIYIDGAYNQGGTIAAGTIGNAYASIGRIEDTGGSPVYLQGELDEVMVFDGVVSDAEVLAGYSNHLAGRNWDGSERICPASDAFAFNCVEPGGDALSGRLLTQRVGDAITLEVVALKDSDGDGNADGVETDFAGTADRSVTVELVDTSTAAACDAYPALNPAASQGVLFTASDAGRRNAVPFTLAKAYRSLGCRVTDNTTATPVVGCSSDLFAVRPLELVVTAPVLNNATDSGAPSAVAGSSFVLQAESVAGYDGTPLVDGSKLQAHAGAVVIGTLNGGFNAAGPLTGSASGSFSYSEVGNFRLLAEGVYDATFTLVDQPSDCINDFSNTRVGGKVGCKFGNSSDSDWVGRFIPNDFILAITDHGVLQNSCLAGGFSYAGQAIGYAPSLNPTATITARNSSGATTLNYTGAYNKLPLVGINMPNVTSDASQLGVDGVNRVGLSWSLGSPGLSDNGDGTLTFTLNGDSFTWGRSTNDMVAPFTGDPALVVQSITDNDGVTGSGLPQTFSPSGTPVRYGRLSMRNAQGSELQPLSIPLQAEYYAGPASGFVENTEDHCSQGLQVSLADIDPTDGLVATTGAGRNTAIYAPASVAGGYAASDLSDLTLLFVEPATGGLFNLNLQAPGQGNTGSANVIVDAPSWLEYDWDGSGAGDPTARATFGIFSRSGGLIYQRENR